MSEDALLGTVAAASAPLVLSVGLLLWDKEWTGSAVMLNALKCSVATVGFLVVAGALAWSGAGGSNDASPGEISRAVGALVLSGFLGIVIGDSLWLLSMQRIGAQKVILVDASKPFIVALLAWGINGEPVKALGLVGMAFTMGCIVLVSTESLNLEEKSGANQIVQQERLQRESDECSRPPLDSVTPEPSLSPSSSPVNERSSLEICEIELVAPTNSTSIVLEGCDFGLEQAPLNQERSKLTHRTTSDTLMSSQEQPSNSDERSKSVLCSSYRVGFVLASLNVLFDSFGYILTKSFSNSFNTFEISGIRFGSSAVFLLMALLSMRLIVRRYPHVSNSKAWWRFPPIARRSLSFVLVGIAFTTFAGPALANYALFHIPLATFATLMALTPVWSIPVSFLIFGTRPSFRAVLGSIGACLGVIPLYV